MHLYSFFCTSFKEIVLKAAAERGNDLQIELMKDGAVLVWSMLAANNSSLQHGMWRYCV